MDKKSYCIAWLMLLFVGSLHAQYRTTTYCNPLNLDYTYPFHNSHLGKSYRSGADPAVVEFRGEYYMFVTRSWGYWHSKDLLNWDFITPEKWYFEGCNAPAAHNYKDSNLIGQHGEFYTVILTDMLQHGQHVEGLLVTSHECGERAAFNLNHLSHNLLFLECSSFSSSMARSTSERR